MVDWVERVLKSGSVEDTDRGVSAFECVGEEVTVDGVCLGNNESSFDLRSISCLSEDSLGVFRHFSKKVDANPDDMAITNTARRPMT